MSDDPATTPPDQLGPPWTILKILRWTTHFFEQQGIDDTARLDAELLLSDVLGVDRMTLYTHFDQPMSQGDLADYRRLVKRRSEGEPAAYLLGTKGFWELELAVDSRALIPRPDTEVLVEEALAILADDSVATVVDVGTGSGAIALALADQRPDVRVVGTDCSADALALAADNVDRLELGGRVTLVESDLLAGVAAEILPVEMVVSNPPYIGEDERDELAAGIRDHEPDQALFGGPDGLSVIRRLVPAAFDSLVEGGHFLCEIGYRQGPEVVELAEDAGFGEVSIRQDYSGHDRVVRARKPSG